MFSWMRKLLTKRKYQKNSDLTQIHAVKNRQNKFIASIQNLFKDQYHWLLYISWWKFLTVISLFYLAVNIIFACAYLILEDGIANAEPGSLSDAFFFSVQTMSTIGYGEMYPNRLATEILVTIEVLIGTILVAILTGLIFARFSRPTARVIFSRLAVICPYNGIPTLMFRVANQRDNRILEAQIKVSMLQNEVSLEGYQLRRFYDLKLLRSQTPSFGLTWLVMHPIDEESPFYNTNSQSLGELDAEIIVILTGLDETFSQTIHARYSYSALEIFWNMRFVDIFSKISGSKKYTINYKRFHDVVKVRSEELN